jgi:tRNA threonylcarbamoyl adenosine modification protein YeaZ
VFVLALDTATAATAVTVLEFDGGGAGAGTTLARRRHVDPRAHGERIAAQVMATLTEVGIGPASLSAIVAGTGPGPFTGLRVGLATAVAMGQTLDIPTYGVCSLDGFPSTVEPVLVATDARRREVYWGIYRDGVALTGPAVDRPAAVLPALLEYGVRLAYGEGALRYRGEFALAVAEDPLYPDPATLARIAYTRIAAGEPGEPLIPRYLRRPDAAEPRPPKPAIPLGSPPAPPLDPSPDPSPDPSLGPQPGPPR